MTIINESKLRHLIKEVCKNEIDKQKAEIELIWKYLNKLSDEVKVYGNKNNK